jgi:hypothetical protein
MYRLIGAGPNGYTVAKNGEALLPPLFTERQAEAVMLALALERLDTIHETVLKLRSNPPKVNVQSDGV